MNKTFNDIEDFLTDESFRSWVTNPTPDLDDQWKKWLEANTDKRALAEEARAFIESLKFNEFEPEKDRKKEIFERVKEESYRQKVVSISSTWYKVAAIIAIGLLISTLYYYNSPLLLNEEVATEVEQVIQKSNPVGIKSQHMLSDGSVVFLNSESSIEYPKKFEGDSRIVVLKGEAYFEVAKDVERPFRVLVDGLEVEVLGTQFNVNANGQKPEVALVEGKVRLNNSRGNASIVMKPGQLATFSAKDDTFVAASFDGSYVTGWKDGILSFQDASFNEVVRKLRAWYGIEITLSNRPKSSDWSYTASFRNESLENVLRNMSTLRNFDYEIKNDSLIINFR